MSRPLFKSLLPHACPRHHPDRNSLRQCRFGGVGGDTVAKCSAQPGRSGISPLYFAAVLFSAWYGGWGPGFLATGLSGIATAYLLMPQTGSAIGARDAILRVLVFTIFAILTSSLHAALKCVAEASRRPLKRSVERGTPRKKPCRQKQIRGHGQS